MHFLNVRLYLSAKLVLGTSATYTENKMDIIMMYIKIVVIVY